MKRLIIIFGPIPFVILAIVTAGLSIAPALFVWDLIPVSTNVAALKSVGFGLKAALCFYVYAFSYIGIAPVVNMILGGKLKPWRGPSPSLRSLAFYRQATLVLVARYTFLEFLTPSAFNVLFYRLMGMRTGKGVALNSAALCDPSLITLGDHAMIGGSASIMAHYAQGSYMVLAPVKIGAKATIGMRAIIMGGVEVGERAKVLANSFVLPNTVIPAGETWGGIPAKKIDLQSIKNENEAQKSSYAKEA